MQISMPSIPDEGVKLPRCQRAAAQHHGADLSCLQHRTYISTSSYQLLSRSTQALELGVLIVLPDERPATMHTVCKAALRPT
jgi:hypothetical protein